MNDYKKLIDDLRTHAEYCDMPFSWMNDAYEEAANAIEQLVKERDAAIADLKTVALNCHEDYTFSACFACEHNSTCNGQPSNGCEFEWRAGGRT